MVQYEEGTQQVRPALTADEVREGGGQHDGARCQDDAARLEHGAGRGWGGEGGGSAMVLRMRMGVGRLLLLLVVVVVGSGGAHAVIEQVGWEGGGVA